MRFNPKVQPPTFLTSLVKEATWRFPGREPVVYLTFDDGPVPEVTPRVLDILAAEQVKATFFCVGDNVRKYPDLYERLMREGHSTGNHTFNHLQGLKTASPEFFRNIEKAGELIDSDLFRPPHGLMRRSQYKYLSNLYRIIMWDVVSGDYNNSLTPDNVFNNVLHYVRPGSIITFHDSVKAQKNLLPVLPALIRELKQQGYDFNAIPNKKATSKKATA